MKNFHKKAFPNLDGLRFAAFMMVFTFHSLYYAIIPNVTAGSIWSRLIKTFLNGSTGVSIFFVISGYLITWLILSEIKRTQKLNVYRFYVRRTLRIWPLYYAVITWMFLVYPYLKSLMGMHDPNMARPLMYYLFLSNFDVLRLLHFFSENVSLSGNITWSLAVEEQFYIVWPLLFLIVPKKFYQYIFYTGILSSFLFRFMNSNDGLNNTFHTLAVMNDLAVGGLAAYYTVNYQKFILFFKQLSRSKIILIYIFGFLMMLFPDLIFIAFFKEFERVLFTLFFTFIILEQNFSDHSFYKFSNWNKISQLGIISYGLYMLHTIVLLFCDIVLRYSPYYQSKTIIVSLVVSGVALAVTIGLAYLSYVYFESYFLKLKEKFQGR